METCRHCGATVEFEDEGSSAVCPECGWSRAASRMQPPSQQKGIPTDTRKICEKFPFFTPGMIAAAMLVVAILPIGEYAYYRILRWLVCGISVFMILIAVGQKRRGWVFPGVGCAILFNPLIPFTFEKETWVVLDLITAIVLFVSIWALKAPLSEPRGAGS